MEGSYAYWAFVTLLAAYIFYSFLLIWEYIRLRGSIRIDNRLHDICMDVRNFGSVCSNRLHWAIIREFQRYLAKNQYPSSPLPEYKKWKNWLSEDIAMCLLEDFLLYDRDSDVKRNLSGIVTDVMPTAQSYDSLLWDATIDLAYYELFYNVCTYCKNSDVLRNCHYYNEQSLKKTLDKKRSNVEELKNTSTSDSQLPA